MDQPIPSSEADHGARLRQSLGPDLAPEMIEPIMAGMRARAVADACERSGLAAVLVDAAGRVLHVASRAQAMLGQGVEVAAGHLVGRTRADNAALQRALTAALTGDEGETISSAAETTYRVNGLPYHDASPCQLLRGILIFSGPNETTDVPALRLLLVA